MIKEYQQSRFWPCAVTYADGPCGGIAVRQWERVHATHARTVYVCEDCTAKWSDRGDQLTPPLRERKTPCTT